MPKEHVPLAIAQALVHAGALHVVTTCGRLYRQSERMGQREWQRVEGPEDEGQLPSWLDGREETEERSVSA